MTELRFQCTAIEEFLEGSPGRKAQRRWRVTLAPMSDLAAGDGVRYSGGTNLVLLVFDEGFAGSFVVGQTYAADFRPE